jgi:hypothetical protein
MLPLWFGAEILSARLAGDVGSSGGVAYWAHVGGFMWGAAIAAAIGHWRLEERFIHSAIEGKITVMSNPIVEEAMEARSTGNLQRAYALLAPAAKNSPNDPDIVTAFWETTCALRCAQEAVPAMYRIANSALRNGDKELAAQYWGEVAECLPEARAESTWLIRLVPALLDLDLRKQAALALRHAVSEEQSVVSLGTSLRVLDLARGVDVHAGISAARRVLASPDFHESKRERVEQQLATLEAEAAHQPSHLHQATGIDRSIAIDDDELMQETADESAVSDNNEPTQHSTGLELDASGKLVATDITNADGEPELLIGLTPEDMLLPPLARFMSVKAMEVKPIELLDHAISIMGSEGKTKKLEYNKISAIAVAAVPGKASKSVLIVDLVLNWNDSNAEILHTVRLRSDEFDVRNLVPMARRPMDAFRAFIAELLSRSAAVPLPDENSARGHPFQSYPDLDTYQRKALSVDH